MTNRPAHISEATWLRMPWHARERAVRAVVQAQRTTAASAAPILPARHRKVRIHRVEPGCWEITNGVSTARTASAQVAWRLLDHLTRTR